MDQRLDRIETNIDVIKTDISEIKTTSAINTEIQKQLTDSVIHHIKRTDILEEIVKTHIAVINSFVKFVIGAGSLLFALHQIGLLQRLF